MAWIIAGIVFLSLIIVLLIFAIRFKGGSNKGEIGERLVAKELNCIRKADDILINNYVFQGEQRSVQIDHILINCFGVYVIETKNYSGIIYGKENYDEWTQVLSYGKVKNRFRNPIKQNAGHIYNLKKILPVNIPVYGLVVFVQNNIDNIQADGVVGLNGLKKAINDLHGENTITSAQIKETVQKLLNECKTDQISNVQHVMEIYKMISGVDSNTVCPRCGGHLVERQGSYGKFVACSNYPKCKFTKKL